MRVKRPSKTASATPPEDCASDEYVDTRLTPLDVTIVGLPTTTQLRTTHGATTAIVTTPKRTAARHPTRQTSQAPSTSTRSCALGRVSTSSPHATPAHAGRSRTKIGR